VIVAVHLVLHGYGHWICNDPRGSGSIEFRQEKFKQLGPIHFGRKRNQPTREELRDFYKRANELLKHKPIWFNSAKRQAISESFARVITARGYRVWACTILQNHAHLCVRAHRDDAVVVWTAFADASRDAIRALHPLDPQHPIWSHRPYKVFLYTPQEVIQRLDYIEDNPRDSQLPDQHWSFVQPCPYPRPGRAI
jgi:hypothetical protein